MKKLLCVLLSTTTLYACQTTNKLPDSKSEIIFEPVNDLWGSYQEDIYFKKYMLPLLDKSSEARSTFDDFIQKPEFQKTAFINRVCEQSFSDENMSVFRTYLNSENIKYTRLESNCSCLTEYLSDKKLYKKVHGAEFKHVKDEYGQRVKTSVAVEYGFSEYDTAKAFQCITDGEVEEPYLKVNLNFSFTE